MLVVAGSAATGCLFLFAGRRERGTWLLGGYFLVVSALVNPFALLGFLRGAPPVEPFGYPDFAFPYFYPFLFAPPFLWAFARECPRVHRGTRLDGLARRMVPVSVLVCCLLWAGVVTWLVLARAGRVAPAVSWAVFDGIFIVLNALSLGAVVVVVLRAYTAPADEFRRVVLFSFGVPAVHRVGGGVQRRRGAHSGGLAVQLPVVRGQRGASAAAVPGAPGALVCGARRPRAAPAGSGAGVVGTAAGERRAARGRGRPRRPQALGWRLAGRLEQELGAVAADPVVQSLGAAALFLLLAAAARGQLRARLDAWLYPDTADQRQALADAAAALAKVGRTTAVSRIVRRTAKRGCGTPVTLLGPDRRRGGSPGPRRPRPATCRPSPARPRSSTCWRRRAARSGSIRRTRRRTSTCCWMTTVVG